MLEVKSLYIEKRYFNPSSFSISGVENTLTFCCFLNVVSSDQIAQFRDNAKAKYSISFEFGARAIALEKNLLYSCSGTESIFLSRCSK